MRFTRGVSYLNKGPFVAGREGPLRMTDDKGLLKPSASRDRQDKLIKALSEFSSNLGAALGNETRWTRLFKVYRRADGSWLAMLGSLDEDNLPIICFGNGGSLMAAWESLGKSMAANQWRVDRYALEEG